jgi:hypothetical protein
MLNFYLINKQGLNVNDVAELEGLHKSLTMIFGVMKELDPTDSDHVNQLHEFVPVIESIEFNMQRVWKFPLTRERHTWWFKVPHCKCPKLDNAEPSWPGRIINGDCPVHGKMK